MFMQMQLLNTGLITETTRMKIFDSRCESRDDSEGQKLQEGQKSPIKEVR